MSADREAAFWCVAPISLIKDRGLSQSAKLLYMLITALQSERGYCYASNQYLAEAIGVDADRSVRRRLQELSDAGYVKIEVVRDEQNTVMERRVYPTISELPLRTADVLTPADKNVLTPADKNVRYNILDNNILPPKAPQGGRKRREPKKQPDHKPERFVKLWEYYPRAGRKSKQAAIRAWDKLKPSDDLIDQMARALRQQKQSRAWQEGIGIPYLSTWLNNARWEDEPDGEDGPGADSGGGEYFSGCPENWEDDT